MRIGLLINREKKEAMAFANALRRWAQEEAGFSFLLPSPLTQSQDRPGISAEQWLREVDAAVVIGGDGTFLRAARFVRGTEIALFGINMGHLGFLATGKPERAKEEILQILRGDFTVRRRQLLEGTLRGQRGEQTFFALNDLVLSKGPLAKLVTIGVEVYDRPMCEFRADGLVVSTPTGSTAYALSAGGPIVPPHVACMILAPICAHTLYSRPIILGPQDRLTLKPRGDNTDLYLTVDGQEVYPVEPGQSMEVLLSQRQHINVVSLPQLDYFDLLHQKLMWGFDPVAPRKAPHA